MNDTKLAYLTQTQIDALSSDQWNSLGSSKRRAILNTIVNGVISNTITNGVTVYRRTPPLSVK
jgi:hypothetical protein